MGLADCVMIQQEIQVCIRKDQLVCTSEGRRLPYLCLHISPMFDIKPGCKAAIGGRESNPKS
jgi:hypothetical protein